MSGAPQHVIFASYGGAVGIDAVIDDANHGTDDLFLSVQCSSGWCG